MPSLFDPVEMGALMLPNRIIMAPLTRARATRAGVPSPIMVDYYAQRAGAGLIISEANGISREGLGWPHAPGLWSDEQVAGWQAVTAAVHAGGGRIVAQLWHMGRLVHDSVSGLPSIGPSALAAPGEAHGYDGKRPYQTPRAATLDDIGRIVGDYTAAARNAIAAGFDGVQIHAANGYLIDQFMRDGSNRRDDDYGGPIANRLRLLRDVVEAVVGAVGADRTAVRFSPIGESQGTNDSNNAALFTAAAMVLEQARVAWLELREPGPNSTFRASDEPPVSPAIRSVFSGKIVLNSDYDGSSAQARLDQGVADAISFGRTFLANPDLVRRIELATPLNAPDIPTFYSQGRHGYTDYPTLAEQVAV